MPDFTPLDPSALRALRRYQRLRQEAARLRLTQLEAQAVIRLAGVLEPGFSPARVTGLRSLSALANRKAAALGRLLGIGRAARFIDHLARLSRRAAGLGRAP